MSSDEKGSGTGGRHQWVHPWIYPWKHLRKYLWRHPRKYPWGRLLQYAPWFMLLLGVDVFACLLLWLADIRAFRAMAAAVFLASIIFFAAVAAVLLILERNRERAFYAFLEMPDEYHEELLRKAVGDVRGEAVHYLANVLREKESVCAGLQTQLEEYEEYVECWAHEAKMPLSLLALLLDNRREELPEAVGFRLDYIENRLGEYIEQMLFYARVRCGRKDYLFEQVGLRTCIEEVLEDYHPLLEEKGFQVVISGDMGKVYTDRRGFRFLLQQLVSNAVKYGGPEPELRFGYSTGERSNVLSVRDNGSGVRSCDLPYIFEKGFAGYSGEGRKEATGMGLYLAREIARDLGLSMEAASGWGEGFEMRICFPVVRE